MNVATEKTVRELVQEFPSATRVFEKFGLDYCCGGKRPLQEACNAANLSVNEVLDSLEAAQKASDIAPGALDWQTQPLTEVVAHIINTHHKYTRAEISRLGSLLAKVCLVHGKNHPELDRMRAVFHGLAQELTMHMMKEEKMLFPYIVRMEEAVIQKEPILPSPFGSVQNPVLMMEHEHDDAGEALRALREMTGGYTVPPDACISYRALFQALAECEADLHQHIHLENNVLFPRAVAMERSR